MTGWEKEGLEIGKGGEEGYDSKCGRGLELLIGTGGFVADRGCQVGQ